MWKKNAEEKWLLELRRIEVARILVGHIQVEVQVVVEVAGREERSTAGAREEGVEQVLDPDLCRDLGLDPDKGLVIFSDFIYVLSRMFCQGNYPMDV